MMGICEQSVEASKIPAVVNGEAFEWKPLSLAPHQSPPSLGQMKTEREDLKETDVSECGGGDCAVAQVYAANATRPCRLKILLADPHPVVRLGVRVELEKLS